MDLVEGEMLGEVQVEEYCKTTLQTDVTKNIEVNIFTDLFGGLLDYNQHFENYFGCTIDRQHTQPLLFGMRVD